MTKIRRFLIAICLFMTFSVMQISVAQDVSEENIDEYTYQEERSTDNGIKNTAIAHICVSKDTPKRSDDDKVVLERNAVIAVVGLNLIITILILIFIFQNNKKIKMTLKCSDSDLPIGSTVSSIKDIVEKSNVSGLNDNINTIKSDVKKIHDKLLGDNIKDGLDTIIKSSIKENHKELIENIKELITDNAASLRETLNNLHSPTDAPTRSQTSKSQLTNNRFKEFYLDVYKKGFKENFGEIIYVCQVFENDEKKARFKITNLEGSMKSYFFNNGDLNNSLICKRLNHVDREKSIKTKTLGILKRKDDGTWEPDTPVEIEFI